MAKLDNSNKLIKITERLNKINFIESFTIEELNTNFAKIKIKYLGKIKNLQNAFFDNGFDIKMGQDQWIVNLL